MRSALLATTLLVLPGIAFADAGQCVLSSGAASSTPPAPVAAAPAKIARPVPSAAVPQITPEQIARVPALQRIGSNGAELFDLGMQHGLHGVFARKGSIFQVFYVTDDGQAAVGGVMWLADGQNITRKQVEPIEGAIPTVTIGIPAAAAGAPATEPAPTLTSSSDRPATSLLKAVEGATFGTMGKDAAPRLWVFVDPLCSFSVRAMGQLRPYVASGKVQLAVIPVSVLDYEDQGRSTEAAKGMLSLPAEAMVAAWGGSKWPASVDPAAEARLAGNMKAAELVGLRGTPTMVWRRADGSEGKSDGLPSDLDALIASLGG